ncbi:MAG: dicarboxylate/amino acid:cation symporter [Synergistales bacterium]|nr:dicarboxylate/amino acid:cation symporter [Synergistales bacterium]MDY6402183.1 dicarboxylate/amino acid:cation symporter [Synergistales bacterium]MDY6404131.1 dicarboxylate/amino acid:cation symporter [Synergistales bacterium]MDY6409751.1 dicarboxylate/amino acid:cation symporter [Synergistales bacterium]MDY6414168.1 dicarboxylate/amino acid:cation symporter [Synergistales bacterium]
MAENTKRVSLLLKISIGFIIGIIFGFAIGPVIPSSPMLSTYVMPFIDLVGKIFLRLLMMLIVPLVFSSLVAGAASVGDVHKLGRIGIKTLVFYFVTTAVAIVLGLACGNLFQPGVGMNIPGELSASAREGKAITDVILDIFPSNPIASMVNANMLQIIVFALFFGVACILAGERGRKIADFFESVAEVMYQVVHIVMSFAPYGVFALIAGTAAKYGIAILAPFAKVIAAVYVGCIIHAVLVYSFMITAFCKRSPFWYFRGVREAAITAFVTRSSSGTLPITLANVRENLGVSEGVSAFVLPLGATINMDGTALYQGVCALFVAQAFGVPLTLSMQLGIVATATLASVGTAGVPGAGLIMLTLVLTSVGLPIEGIALVAGIDVILDAARTCLNVIGDTAVCAVVASSEGDELKN